MIERTTSVGNVATILHGAIDYFKEIGIDYCCGGNRRLTDVLAEMNLPEDQVFKKLEDLEKALQEQSSRQDYAQMSPKELCDYVVATHHAYLRRVLPEIGELLNSVMRAHGAHHKELFKVAQLFGRLRGDLEQHLIQEEMLLFPALLSEDNTKEAVTLTPEIIAEHEGAGKILAELRTITDGYTVPKDGCATYEKVYQMLSELEDDLHRHIHLENNILFKEYDVR